MDKDVDHLHHGTRGKKVFLLKLGKHIVCRPGLIPVSDGVNPNVSRLKQNTVIRFRKRILTKESTNSSLSSSDRFALSLEETVSVRLQQDRTKKSLSLLTVSRIKLSTF